MSEENFHIINREDDPRHEHFEHFLQMSDPFVTVPDEHVLIPVTLMANHALVDGIHITRFFTELEKRISAN